MSFQQAVAHKCVVEEASTSRRARNVLGDAFCCCCVQVASLASQEGKRTILGVLYDELARYLTSVLLFLVLRSHFCAARCRKDWEDKAMKLGSAFRLEPCVHAVNTETLRRATSLYHTLFPETVAKPFGKGSGKRSYEQASSTWQSNSWKGGSWNDKRSSKHSNGSFSDSLNIHAQCTSTFTCAGGSSGAKKPMCFICRETGHLAKDCPKKKY